ncbi:MAG: hypothetical protein SVK08_01745 [Halobacteriota archaeon]|nr:hypothetical protein [Halobacteriota archaeon]
MITIISKQPKCKYCGQPMNSWNPFIKECDQAHSSCEGEAMGRTCAGKVSRDIEAAIERMGE